MSFIKVCPTPHEASTAPTTIRSRLATSITGKHACLLVQWVPRARSEVQERHGYHSFTDTSPYRPYTIAPP